MTKDDFFELISSDEFEGNYGYDDWIDESFIDFFNENNEDQDVFFEALKFHPSVLNYVSDQLKDNYEFMSYSIKEWGKEAFFYCSGRLKNERNLVLLTIEFSNETFQDAILEEVSDSLRNDPEIIRYAMFVVLDPHATLEFKYASNELKNNKSFIIEQLQRFTDSYKNPHWTPNFLQFMSENLKNDTDFVNELIDINAKALICLNLK